jgi:hypothetical protein
MDGLRVRGGPAADIVDLPEVLTGGEPARVRRKADARGSVSQPLRRPQPRSVLPVLPVLPGTTDDEGDPCGGGLVRFRDHGYYGFNALDLAKLAGSYGHSWTRNRFEGSNVRPFDKLDLTLGTAGPFGTFVHCVVSRHSELTTRVRATAPCGRSLRCHLFVAHRAVLSFKA